MLFQAERYALNVLVAEKFIVVVVTSRSELISFYLRHVYGEIGSIMDSTFARCRHP
jgi:hypothetical protein